MDDPQVQPLLKTAASFDCASYGFTRSRKPQMSAWNRGPLASRYDAMLHIYSKTSRTIGFRKTSKGYRWIGDQEIFQGPKGVQDGGRYLT
jgi:hypothetical protein